jgi:hypothetical protein
MRPSDGRISLWPVAVIGFIVLLLAACITPVVRLNTTPPSDFVALKTSAKGSNTATASRYWDAAVRVVQWKYNRTSTLPAQAPADFSLTDESNKRVGGENEAARFAYWARLREDWLKAENWHTTYSFDLSWIARDLQYLWSAAMNFVSDHS